MWDEKKRSDDRHNIGPLRNTRVLKLDLLQLDEAIITATLEDKWMVGICCHTLFHRIIILLGHTFTAC